MTKVKSKYHGAKLIKDISSLSEVDKVNNKFSDIQVKVGDRIFYCHKLVLKLNSDHFAEHEFTLQEAIIHDIDAHQFYDVLQFMYTGEVQMDKSNIGSVLAAADILRMEDLKKVCFGFLADELITDDPMQCWRLANTYQQSILAARCHEQVLAVFFSDTSQLRLISNLTWVSEEMMVSLLSSDSLEVKSEVEVCEILIKWLELQTEAQHDAHPEHMLPLIRWSGISIGYIKARLLQNSLLVSSETCMTFIAKVINYKQCNIQFEGLKTFYRKSIGMNNSVIIFGLGDEESVTHEVLQINLQQPDSVSAFGQIPTKMWHGSQLCGIGNDLYVSGVGDGQNETWRLDLLSAGWFKCNDMITGRSEHSAVIVDTQLYLLGGLANRMALNSVDCYNIVTKTWFAASNLTHAVYDAASMTYMNAIYVFGGFNGAKGTAYVQVYDPAQQWCTLLDTPMPETCWGFRAVMWETSAILMGPYNCLVYNFETKTWLERNAFSPYGVWRFGSVLDNQTIYIAGGYKMVQGKDNEWIRTNTDEIRYISVLDIIKDCGPVAWNYHTKLPRPARINAYCLTLLASIVTCPVDGLKCEQDDEEDDEEDDEKYVEEDDEEYYDGDYS